MATRRRDVVGGRVMFDGEGVLRPERVILEQVEENARPFLEEPHGEGIAGLREGGGACEDHEGTRVQRRGARLHLDHFSTSRRCDGFRRVAAIVSGGRFAATPRPPAQNPSSRSLHAVCALVRRGPFVRVKGWPRDAGGRKKQPRTRFF